MADTAFNSDIAIEAPTTALKHIDTKGNSLNVRAPFAKLMPLPGFNVRVKNADYQASVREFADSIRENGYYDHKPLAVIVLPGDDTLWVWDGETRYDAIKLLATEGTVVEEVPVSLAPAGTTVEDLTVAMSQSNEGVKLSPIALAALVKRLMSYGWDKDKVALRIGKTVRYLDNLLVLAGAPKAVRDAVADNKIAAAEAVKIVRKDPKTAAATVTAKVKAAEAKGQTKATPKRSATGPKMKAVKVEFSVPEGDKMGEVLKGVAKRIREEFNMDAQDVLEETGSITVIVHVIDHEAEAAAAAKVAAAAAAAKVAATPKPAKPAAAPKARATPKADAKPVKPAKPAKAAATPKKAPATPKAKPAAVKTPTGDKTPETPAEPPVNGAPLDPAPDAPEAGAPAADGQQTGDDGMGGL